MPERVMLEFNLDAQLPNRPGFTRHGTDHRTTHPMKAWPSELRTQSQLTALPAIKAVGGTDIVVSRIDQIAYGPYGTRQKYGQPSITSGYRVPRYPAPIDLRLDGNEGQVVCPDAGHRIGVDIRRFETVPVHSDPEAAIAKQFNIQPEQVCHCRRRRWSLTHVSSLSIT